MLSIWPAASLVGARARVGRTGEGVSLIRQALVGFEEKGARVGNTDVLTRLTEAQALDGATREARDTMELALKANPEELVFRPNTLRYRGALRLKVGQIELAEADFRDAITMARRMSARTWELRTAMNMARLWRDQGRGQQAHDILAPVYGSFTEGFDTPVLKDAKTLLDELVACLGMVVRCLTRGHDIVTSVAAPSHRELCQHESHASMIAMGHFETGPSRGRYSRFASNSGCARGDVAKERHCRIPPLRTCEHIKRRRSRACHDSAHGDCRGAPLGDFGESPRDGGGIEGRPACR
jgi:hypothetical protein